MQRETIDYRHPDTPVQRRAVWWVAMVVTGAVLLVVSIIFCIATWNAPGRFIFLPAGDVGLGFRSYAGWLEWIQYASWMSNPDYVKWSLPWFGVCALEGLMIALPLYVRWRSRAVKTPGAMD